MKEIWKPAIYNDISFDGYYEVSNLGNVRSVDRMIKHSRKGYFLKKGNAIKEKKTKWGYLSVEFCVNLKRKSCYVHRLVVCSFLNTPKKGECVHHINSVKTDNRIDNLKIITTRENCSIEKTIKSGLSSGVSYNKINSKYGVRIRYGNNKKRYFGYYEKYSHALDVRNNVLHCINKGKNIEYIYDLVDDLRGIYKLKPIKRNIK